jgi:hypothetical protein
MIKIYDSKNNTRQQDNHEFCKFSEQHKVFYNFDSEKLRTGVSDNPRNVPKIDIAAIIRNKNSKETVFVRYPPNKLAIANPENRIP